MLIGFLLKGMLVGIVIAVPVGPVGVLCIRRTILDGRLAGLFSGIGAATADSMFGDHRRVRADGACRIGCSAIRIGCASAAAAFLFYVGFSALFHDPGEPRAPEQDAGRAVRRFRLDLCADDHEPGDDPVVPGGLRRMGFTGHDMTMGAIATWCWASGSARWRGGWRWRWARGSSVTSSRAVTSSGSTAAPAGSWCCAASGSSGAFLSSIAADGLPAPAFHRDRREASPRISSAMISRCS